MDQLEAFVSAAEKGSFSAAGRALRKAQSAVSTQVSNLETDLGVMLVESETNHAWRDFYCEATEPQRLRVVMRVRGVSFEQKGLTDANLLVRIRDLAGNPAPTLIFELPTSPTDGTWTTVHGETMVFPGGNRISLITAQRAYEMNSKVISTSDEMMSMTSMLRS